MTSGLVRARVIQIILVELYGQNEEELHLVETKWCYEAKHLSIGKNYKYIAVATTQLTSHQLICAKQSNSLRLTYLKIKENKFS